MYSLFNFFLIPPLPPSPHEPFSMQLGAVTAFSICLSQSASLLPLSAWKTAWAVKRRVRKKKNKERKKCTFLSKTAIRTSNGWRCRSKLRRQKNVKKNRQWSREKTYWKVRDRNSPYRQSWRRWWRHGWRNSRSRRTTGVVNLHRRLSKRNKRPFR